MNAPDKPAQLLSLARNPLSARPAARTAWLAHCAAGSEIHISIQKG